MNYIHDAKLRLYLREERHDLGGANVPRQGPSQYRVFEYTVPDGQVLIVRNIIPYVMERTDIGSASESAQIIDPEQVNGLVAFEPYVNNQTAHIIEINYNLPTAIGSTPDDATRTLARGITHVSADPWIDARRGYEDSIYSFPVPAQATFTVVFRILPAGTNFNTFAIASGAKRIDFAGVVIIGVQLSESDFRKG